MRTLALLCALYAAFQTGRIFDGRGTFADEVAISELAYRSGYDAAMQECHAGALEPLSYASLTH